MLIFSKRIVCMLINFMFMVKANQHFENYGDLYVIRQSDVYSLSWIIEINPICNIEDILEGCCNIKICESKFLVDRKIFKLILLKKFKEFRNVYLIAHAYHNVYKKFRSYLIQRYKKFCRHNCSISREVSIPSQTEVFSQVEKCVQKYLIENKCVLTVQQDVHYHRSKRNDIKFSDPLYEQQWHLHSSKEDYDINVQEVWKDGITGRGVTVCVIDDGVEWNHPDLIDNYVAAGSYDLKANDPDPSPAKVGDHNEHGTRCAGEIAASANNICGVGVAHRANISGIRVLGGRIADSMEASAFIHALDINDVYSCSWGPKDDGKTIDGPHMLANKALEHGITHGRNGYGAIYIMSSGNGGKNHDNCNYDGYANSAHTITIGAITSIGKIPYYSEECSVIFAVAPSSGAVGKSIVTTDWRETSKTGCTTQHSGTSAAAPLAAGVVALALELNPCLSWRDIQYLIAFTSRKINAYDAKWTKTSSGLFHSHTHGFGLIDAAAMVSAAAVWESVPFWTSYRSDVIVFKREIVPVVHSKVDFVIHVEENILDAFALKTVEYVQVYVTMEHERRGGLKFTLKCPSGTKSVLATPRSLDDSKEGLKSWPFGTVRCLGEVPHGNYTFTVINTNYEKYKGRLVSIQLVIYGSQMTLEQFQSRKNLVARAIRGENVFKNKSVLCHVPPINFPPYLEMSARTLKMLLLTGCILALLAVYHLFEYAFCYGKEKQHFSDRIEEIIRSRSMGLSTRISRSSTVRFDSANETDSFPRVTAVSFSHENTNSPNGNCLSSARDIPNSNEISQNNRSFSNNRNSTGSHARRDSTRRQFNNSKNTSTAQKPRNMNNSQKPRIKTGCRKPLLSPSHSSRDGDVSDTSEESYSRHTDETTMPKDTTDFPCTDANSTEAEETYM